MGESTRGCAGDRIENHNACMVTAGVIRPVPLQILMGDAGTRVGFRFVFLLLGAVCGK